MRHHTAAVLVLAVLILTGCGDDPAEVDTGTPVDRTETC